MPNKIPREAQLNFAIELQLNFATEHNSDLLDEDQRNRYGARSKKYTDETYEMHPRAKRSIYGKGRTISEKRELNIHKTPRINPIYLYLKKRKPLFNIFAQKRQMQIKSMDSFEIQHEANLTIYSDKQCQTDHSSVSDEQCQTDSIRLWNKLCHTGPVKFSRRLSQADGVKFFESRSPGLYHIGRNYYVYSELNAHKNSRIKQLNLYFCKRKSFDMSTQKRQMQINPMDSSKIRHESNFTRFSDELCQTDSILSSEKMCHKQTSRRLSQADTVTFVLCPRLHDRRESSEEISKNGSCISERTDLNLCEITENRKYINEELNTINTEISFTLSEISKLHEKVNSEGTFALHVHVSQFKNMTHSLQQKAPTLSDPKQISVDVNSPEASCIPSVEPILISNNSSHTTHNETTCDYQNESKGVIVEDGKSSDASSATLTLSTLKQTSADVNSSEVASSKSVEYIQSSTNSVFATYVETACEHQNESEDVIIEDMNSSEASGTSFETIPPSTNSFLTTQLETSDQNESGEVIFDNTTTVPHICPIDGCDEHHEFDFGLGDITSYF